MKVSAATDMIAVTPVKLSDIPQGIFQAASEKQPEIGRVFDIGPKGKKNWPFGVKGLSVGDLVLYRKYGSSNFVVGGAEYAFVGFDDIVGKVEEA